MFQSCCSYTNKPLRHLNSQLQTPSTHCPISKLEISFCSDKEKSLGSERQKGASSKRLSFQNSATLPLLIFQVKASSNHLTLFSKLHTSLRSCYQIESPTIILSLTNPLHPPYLEVMTSLHRAFSPWKRLHLHLPNNAPLKIMMSLIPSPPLSFA